MFKLATTPSYWQRVTVDFPADNGKKDSRAFDAQFRRFAQSELDELRKQLVSGTITDREFVDRVLIGWKGLIDEQDQPVEFNETNLDRVLELYPTQPSIISAFFKSVNGAREKN